MNHWYSLFCHCGITSIPNCTHVCSVFAFGFWLILMISCLYFSAQSQWVWTAFALVDKYGMPWNRIWLWNADLLANNQNEQVLLLYRTIWSHACSEKALASSFFSRFLPFSCRLWLVLYLIMLEAHELVFCELFCHEEEYLQRIHPFRYRDGVDDIVSSDIKMYCFVAELFKSIRCQNVQNKWSDRDPWEFLFARKCDNLVAFSSSYIITRCDVSTIDIASHGP
jgi:hypothetical protein